MLPPYNSLKTLIQSFEDPNGVSEKVFIATCGFLKSIFSDNVEEKFRKHVEEKFNSHNLTNRKFLLSGISADDLWEELTNMDIIDRMTKLFE